MSPKTSDAIGRFLWGFFTTVIPLLLIACILYGRTH